MSIPIYSLFLVCAIFSFLLSCFFDPLGHHCLLVLSALTSNIANGYQTSLIFLLLLFLRMSLSVVELSCSCCNFKLFASWLHRSSRFFCRSTRSLNTEWFCIAELQDLIVFKDSLIAFFLSNTSSLCSTALGV